MSISAAQIRQVQGAARYAARHGIPLELCPYDASGGPDQKALMLLWVRAYLRARPASAGAVSYDDDQHNPAADPGA